MKNSKRNKKYGFTLIELMVAVIIIAVLAAVAVPQYKKAVLKSRYSTLMPVANSLAKGNEVYYLSQGEYSKQESKLDVEGQLSVPEGTEIVLETDPEYLSYVRVANESKVPNARYVVYQQHSKNFAGTTMCEAKDDTAKELCQSLGGVFVSEGGTQSGWTSYLLSGQLSAGDAFDDNQAGGTGASEDNDTWTYVTSTRQWDGNLPSCNVSGVWTDCTYNYTGGETLRAKTVPNGYFNTHTSWGYEMYAGYGNNDSLGQAGNMIVSMKDANGKQRESFSFNSDGSVEWMDFTDGAGNVVYFDGSGGLTEIIKKSGLPDSVTSLSYDRDGNVRSAQINGTWYSYNANGESTTSGAPDVSSYALSSAELADYSTIAQPYVGKTKCQIYQELEGC